MLYINKIKKIFYQDKKKKYLKKKQNQKNSTLVTKDNTIKIEKNWNNQSNKNYIIVKKRVILLGIILNFQKTSVNLGNLYNGN